MRTKRILSVPVPALAFAFVAFLAACDHVGGLLGKLEPRPRCSPDKLEFVEAEGTPAVTPQEIILGNDGDEPVDITLSEDAGWLTLSAYSCTSEGPEDDVAVQVTPDVTSLATGTHRATILAQSGDWQKAVEVEVVVAPAGANVIYVSATGDDAMGNGSLANPYRTITKGVSMLTVIAGADTVYILPSDAAYGVGETFPVHPDVLPAGAATLMGAGPEQVRISGRGASRVLELASVNGCTLSGLTIADGTTPSGEAGGGLLVTGGSVTATDCVFEDCVSDGNGGAVEVADGCASTFTRCAFTGNHSGGGGGAVHDAAAASGPPGSSYTDCLFEGNVADDEGGAMTCVGAKFDGCFFSGNSATLDGGACFAVMATATFLGCTFETSAAGGAGGGLYAGIGVLANGTRFYANSAGGDGGGCLLASGGTLNNCVLDSNLAAGSGGGAHCTGSPTITACLVTNNASQVDGGGICLTASGVAAASASVQVSRLMHNSAVGNGGALFLDGGVSVGIVRNTFAHNSAAGGGGVHVADGKVSGPSGQFRNNLLHHNEGGFSIGTGSADLWNCTFADNSPYGLKRLSVGAPTLDIMNSVFWGNVDASRNPNDLDNVPTGSVSYCDVGDALLPGAGNISADPLFSNVPGEDYRLRESSPCVDAGRNFAGSDSDTDLDGKPRKVDGDGDYEIWNLSNDSVDMGCHEYQP